MFKLGLFINNKHEPSFLSSRVRIVHDWLGSLTALIITLNLRDSKKITKCIIKGKLYVYT